MARGSFTETGYNHHDPDIAQNPYALFDEVRANCPLGHSPALGGFFFPTTYEGVKSVFADWRSFTSTQGTGLPDQLVALLPTELDPPRHTAWRRTLNRFFTVEAAEADRPRIERLAHDLIDSFAARGEADFVNEFTRPFLALTMLPVIGVPMKDREMLGGTLLWMVHNRVTDHEGWVAKYGECAAYLTALSAARRRSERKDDLLQCLIDEDFDGARLDDQQIFQVLMLVLFGALDSSSATMSGALYHLAQNPSDKQRLLTGEISWDQAFDEFLRFISPIQTLRRTTSREAEIDGAILEPGDVVLASNAAANHDPAKYPEPGKCILDRDARDHLAFGTGAHICIGRHYAKVIVDVCLAAMLARIPDFAPADGFDPQYTASEARGLKSLTMIFTPAGERSPTA